jgi:hypothetical protein
MFANIRDAPQVKATTVEAAATEIPVDVLLLLILYQRKEELSREV